MKLEILFNSNLAVGLAGATADVHCYDVISNKWSRYAEYQHT